MKTSVFTCVAALLLCGAAVGYAAEPPSFPQPTQEHQWLQRLVGEWDAEVQIFMEPGKPPMESKGTESVRAVGGYWTLAENKGTFANQPFTGLMTLGYDAEKKKYIGTWVDSMNGHFWKYDGSVDKNGKLLTLEAKGPCPMRPGQVLSFKETLEIKTKDHKVFTSAIELEEGKWTTTMVINYRRKP